MLLTRTLLSTIKRCCLVDQTSILFSASSSETGLDQVVLIRKLQKSNLIRPINGKWLIQYFMHRVSIQFLLKNSTFIKISHPNNSWDHYLIITEYFFHFEHLNTVVKATIVFTHSVF